MVISHFFELLVTIPRATDIVVPRGAENLVAIELIAQHINSVLIEREASEALAGMQALAGEAVAEA